LGSRTHTETFASTLRGLSLSWTEWRVRLSLSMQYHAHALNVRVDLESSVVFLDRMKSETWYTRTECPRWPCEVQSWLRTDWRTRRDTRAQNVCVGLVRSSRGFGQIEELNMINAHCCFKKRQQKQRSRFLQEYKSETSYTLEDGHVGRN
jgi:hypothetical protein